MQIGKMLLLAAGLMFATSVLSYDIGLVPLHEFSEQGRKSFGLNISLQGTPHQIAKMRRWITQIAGVPKGLKTLQEIDESGHKLMIFHSVDDIPFSL